MSITLSPIGSYRAGIFDEGGAEIVAHDPATQRLFITNGNDKTVDVISIADPATPVKLSTLVFPDAFEELAPTSVAVNNGIVAVAVPADPVTDPGHVLFFDTDGNFHSSAEVGALPDMLTFTPDGQMVLVANEGEPGDGIDPDGSVSIIDISSGTGAPSLETATFTAFNGREAELQARGVRLFPDKQTAEDVEPEYIAVSPDGTTAFVTLQENNAFGVVDIASATVADILPLGVKDHGRGQPRLETIDLTDILPELGTTAAGQTLKLGGLSGLWYDGTTDEGTKEFWTVPDRGPNPDTIAGDRPFALPDYQARLHKIEVAADGTTQFTDTLFLTREVSGAQVPITGISNNASDEPSIDIFGDPVDFDAFGGDLEGVARDGAGNFWLVDEYRPAIYKLAPDGVLIDRFVPEGTATLVGAAAGDYGSETLPEEYASRRPNRGFEAVAVDPENDVVYAFIQTPLANPDRDTSDNSDVIRILGIDGATGTPVSEHVYLLDGSDFRDSIVDKIGDAVYAGDGKFFVIERDSSTEAFGKKFIFEVDLKGATNLLDAAAPALPAGETLELQTADDLAGLGIQPVNKIKVLNLPSIGYQAGDKPEGLALLDDGSLAVLNDNDFSLTGELDTTTGAVGVAEPTSPTVLGFITFGDGNGLDASDDDGAINIQNWPIYGMYMPDAIRSFEVDGKAFYITANEGDARDEDARIKDLVLDPDAFPNAAELQGGENLGRLAVSTIDGDIDGDGDYDQLFAYGGRSFSISDRFGNLVYDSGDEFEQIVAKHVPEFFNSDNDESTFDTRSDAKGPEPEGVAIGVIDGTPYAFIGLERVGGVITYDVSDPTSPRFVGYNNNRDFSADPETPEAGDLAPEGLAFISPNDSPNGAPLLVIANEVSGSTTVNQIDFQGVDKTGTEGDDSLEGTIGGDTLNGLGGDDSLDGGNGDDSVIGGEGDDTLSGGRGADDLAGNGGDDLLMPGLNSGTDTVNGGEGDDTVDYTDAGEAGFAVTVDLDEGGAEIATPSMMSGRNSYIAKELFTVGETVNGYTPAGILDGMGAYEYDADTIRVLVNHEISPDQGGYAYEVSDGAGGRFELSAARISYFDVNKNDLSIEDAGAAYERIYDRNGEVMTDPSQFEIAGADEINFNEDTGMWGFNRFCSSGLFEPESFGADQGLVDRIYFTGEETAGGTEWAVDVENGDIWAVPMMGRGNWENITLIDTGVTDKVAFIMGDDAQERPLYLYVGEKDTSDGAGFLARNGLADGKLYMWRSTTGEAAPSEFLGDGNALDGEWVEVPNYDPAKAGTAGYDDAGYLTQDALLEFQEVQGAFRFSRPEDVATNPADGMQVVLASTGRSGVDNGADTWGTTYIIDAGFDASGEPTGAKLSILYDGDGDSSRTLRSPDNLDWADDGYIYVQEDRALDDRFATEGNTNEASIVRLDPNAPGGDPVQVAEMDRTSVLPLGVTDGDPDDVGDWESSGILDVSTLFDRAPGELLLFNVQAHSLRDGVIESEGLVQGGQLNMLYKPGASPFGPPPVGTDELDDVENVLGTQFSDVINGDDNDNLLQGTDGEDTMDGRGGDDTLEGGGDDDSLSGGVGDDVLSGGGDDDVLEGGEDDDQLAGGNGDDTLMGDENDDELAGGDGDDTLDGGEDDDELSGDRGEDLIIGGTGNDNLDGGRDDDVLEGGDGDDDLEGGRGDDFLDGGEGEDNLSGGRGDDTLNGGEGDDDLTGGRGDDTFVVELMSGVDVITDFEAGEDIIDVTGFGFAEFACVLGRAEQDGDDVHIELKSDNGEALVLLDVSVDDLEEEDFILS